MDRTHEQRTAEPRLLGERYEDFRLGRLARLFLLNIAGDADDLAREALTQIVMTIFRPMGFSPVKYCRAIVSLMIATGRPFGRSRSSNSRPVRRGSSRCGIGRADGAVRHQYVAVGQRIARG